MDEKTLASILTFFSGAVIALLPGIINYFAEGKKHRLEVRKLYFENKYKVLQAYVSHCTTLSGTFFNNVIMLGEVIKRDNFFGKDNDFREAAINNLQDHIGKSLASIDQLALLSSAALMFIDLKIDIEKSQKLIHSIHSNFSELGTYSDRVYEKIHEHHFEMEPSQETKTGKEYFELKRQYKNHIQKIADTYQALRNMIDKTISDVRKDVKRFKV